MTMERAVSLRGLSAPSFAGYVNISSDGSSVFYWRIEAPSSSSSSNDDVVIVWLQGGPGVSSLEALWRDQLVDDTYSWTRVAAHVVYWELPAGLGFSASARTDATDEAYRTQAARVLRELSERIPRGRRWFLAAESYGGVYAALAATTDCPKIEGIFVSNACTGTDAGPCATRGRAARTLEVITRQGFVPRNLTAKIMQICDPDDLARAAGECEASLRKASDLAGPLYTYNLAVPCANGETFADFACGHALRRGTAAASWACSSSSRRRRWRRHKCGGNATCACADARLDDYLNSPDVRAALGVPIAYRRTRVRYRRTAKNVIPIYKRLLAKGLRLVVLAGRLDAQVPAEATVDWVRGLGFPQKNEFKISNATIFDFGVPPPAELKLAVLDYAGHAVMKYQPNLTLHLLDSFLQRRAYS